MCVYMCDGVCIIDPCIKQIQLWCSEHYWLVHCLYVKKINLYFNHKKITYEFYFASIRMLIRKQIDIVMANSIFHICICFQTFKLYTYPHFYS